MRFRYFYIKSVEENIKLISINYLLLDEMPVSVGILEALGIPDDLDFMTKETVKMVRVNLNLKPFF